MLVINDLKSYQNFMKQPIQICWSILGNLTYSNIDDLLLWFMIDGAIYYIHVPKQLAMVSFAQVNSALRSEILHKYAIDFSENSFSYHHSSYLTFSRFKNNFINKLARIDSVIKYDHSSVYNDLQLTGYVNFDKPKESMYSVPLSIDAYWVGNTTYSSTTSTITSRFSINPVT